MEEILKSSKSYELGTLINQIFKNKNINSESLKLILKYNTNYSTAKDIFSLPIITREITKMCIDHARLYYNKHNSIIYDADLAQSLLDNNIEKDIMNHFFLDTAIKSTLYGEL